MKLIWNTIQLAFAAVGGFVGWFLGGCDGLLYTLLAFVVIDYITGVLCAVSDKKLSSAIGFKGICRKVLIFALVGIGHILDLYVIGNGSVMRTAILFFYISNEGVSLVENAVHLGLPVPQKLKDRYGLVEKNCPDNKKTYRDLLIYRKDYHLSELDRRFITELCLAKRQYI